MTKPAYIFGSGGHAYVIASILKCEVTFFLVEGSASNSNEISQSDFFDRIGEFLDSDIYIGIGDNKVRRKIFDELVALGISPANCIDESSFVAADAHLGSGVVVCPNSVVGSRAQIGNNTIINSLSSVDHDCVLGEHSQVTAGVTIAGGVNIGSNCFFGVKSAVIPGIAIGDSVVVMAGAVVTKNMPSNVLIGGSPARVVREL